MNNESFKLKEIYSDIINGYSSFLKDGEIVFVKHFTLQDLSKVDVYQDLFLQEALGKGLKTDLTREKELIKKKLWGDREKIDSIQQELDVMKENLEKDVYRGIQIKLVREEITKKEAEISELMTARKALVGMTAEDYLKNKIDQYYIICSLFKDSEFKNQIFNWDSFNTLSEEDLGKINSLYNKKISNFFTSNFRKIALFPSFSNLYYLCDNNPLILFGKSLVNLTFYQIELFSYGKYYKTMLDNISLPPPNDVRADPDLLEEWYESAIAAQEVMSKNNNKAGVGVAGKPGQLMNKGLKSNANLGAVAKSKGGVMDMADVMRSHGIPVAK